MDTKQMLEKTITHVIKQGKPSTGANGLCSYRGTKGTMCAIGSLIPDTLYSYEMEGKSVFSSIVQDTLNHTFGIKLNMTQLDQLGFVQKSHDRASEDEDFLQNFKDEITWRVRQKDLPEYCLEFLAPQENK